jgi:hypothetical protein
VGALIASLGIPLVPVKRPGDAYASGQAFTVDLWGAGAPAGFRAFMADMRALRDVPVLPVESASSAALGYDAHSLAQLARPYGADVMRFLDLYARSVLGAPAAAVSAYAGLRFLEFPIGLQELNPLISGTVGPANGTLDDVARVRKF